ncbi:MAG: hypothetical protein IJ745_04000 [Bacteroidales bacterium]|nr:hypothetical protein [Bacteroidales bacterium]
MLIDYPWYFVLLCLLVGAAYAAVLYRWGYRFDRWLNVLMSAVRFVAVSVIALLLLAPVARRTVHERQKPRVDLIEDCSQSVQLCSDSSFRLTVLGDGLSDHCDVALESDASNTGRTDLGVLFDAVRPDVSAVVLASDGINNHGQNPVSVVEHLGVPVYTVALGDTMPRCDAALTNLRHNKIAYLGTSFPVEVTINAHLLRGQHAVLAIVDEKGRSLVSQAVDYSDDNFSATLSFSLPAEEKGMHRYVVDLSVAENEVERSNNVLSFYADVIDGRRKALIVGHAPHPDLGALKEAVESNPNYEARVVLAEALQTSKVNIKDSNYSLVFLHNLPSAMRQVPRELDGLPMVFIVGVQTDIPRFNALHSGLEIVAKAKKSNEMTAVFNENFSLFNFDPSDGEAFEQMPPLDVPFGEGRVNASLQTLFSARLGNIDTRQPLVAATSQGPQRRVFVWGEGLWKWRISDFQNNASHEHFDRLVSQIVTFAAATDNRNRFIVETDRSYSDADAIVVRAQLYNEAYELFNSPAAMFSLFGDSVDGDYEFTRRGDGYELTLGRLPEGLYRYRASTSYNDATLVDEGSFVVEATHLEQANLTADHTLLRTISAVSGGRMVYPDQIDDLRDELLALKPTIYTHTRYSELLGLPWLMLILVLLLGTEWVLRKYHGEI